MNFFDMNAYYKNLKILEEKENFKYLKISDAEEIFRNVKVCSFTGHRPEKLNLTEESDENCVLLKLKIRSEIEFAIHDGFTVFLTGMARGIDTWAAEAVLEIALKKELPLKLYAAIPHPNQSETWLEWEKERYEEILQSCEGIFLVSEKYAPNCMQKRNEFLVKHGDCLIAVYDGKSGGTENTVKMAEKSKKSIRFISL